MAMTFSVNDGPLAGATATKLTSRMIRDRLMREAEGNVAIRISESEARTPSRSPAAASCSWAC